MKKVIVLLLAMTFVDTARAGWMDVFIHFSHKGRGIACVGFLAGVTGMLYWWLAHKNVEAEPQMQPKVLPSGIAVGCSAHDDAVQFVPEFDSLSDQRNLIIINDFMRFDHEQWDIKHPYGGALTTDLFCALQSATAPIYSSKTLLAYVSAIACVDNAYIVELFKHWDIYDINPEYCLLLPKRWVIAYQKSAHGLGIVVDDKQLVTTADICAQLTGDSSVTIQAVVAQTGPDGNGLIRRRHLLQGLESLLVGAVRWNVLIIGHGGAIGGVYELACLNEYLAGMPRQTFITMLEDLSRLTTVRLVYLCTCHSAGRIREAAFDNDGRHRKFDFPIICCSCTDEPVFGKLNFTEFFKQIRVIPVLDLSQEKRMHEACIRLNERWRPSVCWAGACVFVPLKSSDD